MGNSIGSLFIDITARTAQVEKDLGRVKAQVKDLQDTVSQINNTGGAAFTNLESKVLRFGVAMLGAQSIIRVLAKDVRSVVMNVEDLKGLDPNVTESIQNLRHELLGANSAFKEGIALELSWGVNLGQALGRVAGMMANSVDGKMPSSDEVGAAIGDTFAGGSNTHYTQDQLSKDKMGEAAFTKALQTAQEALTKAKLDTSRASMTEAEQIKSLNAESQYYYIKSNSSQIDSIEKDKLQLEGYRLKTEAERKLGSLQDQYNTAQDKYYKSQVDLSNVFVSKTERVVDLKAKLVDLQGKLADLAPQDPVTGMLNLNTKEWKPEDLAQGIRLMKELTQTTDQLTVAQRKLGDFFKDLGDGVAKTFTNGILQGGKFADTLRSIGQEILKIIATRYFETPLASFITNGLGAAFGGGGSGGVGNVNAFGASYAAAGGPIDGPTWVGENGPELISGTAGQTVTPNSQLRGGGGGGDIYNIDARSADRTGLASLYSLIQQLNGSINQRAVAAVNNANRRKP